MELHWGYYCLDCQETSPFRTHDSRRLRHLFEKGTRKIDRLWKGDTRVSLPGDEVSSIGFLARHYHHRLAIKREEL